MAINDPTNPNIAPGSSGFQPQQPQAQTQQSAPQQPRRNGARNINQVMGRPFSKSAINETLSKINKIFNDYLETEVQQLDSNFRILTVDSKQSLTALSAIVVCYLRGRAGKDTVSYATILVEGNVRLNTRTVNENGMQVEVITTAGDVADTEMNSRVKTAVMEMYNRPGIDLLDAGANVIYNEANIDDKHSLRSIFANAIQACYHSMVANGIIDERPFNANAIGANDNMIARLENYPQPLHNSSDLPIRSDLSVQLQAVVSQSSQSLTEQVVGLTDVDGYIDLVYVPMQQQMQQGAYPGMMMNQDTRRYAPRVVITNISPLVDASTMELQLLGLASATILSENSTGIAPWMNAFKPRTGLNKDEVDLRDIGAVGLEVNLMGDAGKPGIIDTKSNKFGTPDLYRLLTQTIFPELIYSIDIDEVGDMSYLNLAMVDAATPGKGQRAAREWIIQSANALTNGAFGRLFPADEPLFYDDNNRIFTGYYVNKSGEKKDIRDIDYLAMLNLVGKKDPQYIKEWSETYDRANIPLAIRMDRRRRIYESVLPGQVVIKGYARRITVMPKFIITLAQACKESGLVFRPSNLNQDFINVGEHGIANANTLFGVRADQRTGLFSHSSQNSNNSSGGFAMPGFGGYGIQRNN